MARRLKVLLSAYACEPHRGSEPEVGWQWLLQAAEFADVTVLTRANNRDCLESAHVLQDTGVKFIFHDPPEIWIRLKKMGILPVPIFYLIWQVTACRTIAMHDTNFDLVHHVTFNSFLMPGFWWRLPIPAVLGPLGGGMVCPPKFLSLFGGKAGLEFVRSLVVKFGCWIPWVDRSLDRAVVILVANKDTLARIPQKFRAKCLLHLETGIVRIHATAKSERLAGAPCRVLWMGRLEPRKCIRLALFALAEALKERPDFELTVVGTGPEFQAAKEWAEKLGLRNKVLWTGKISRDKVPEYYEHADVFLFTSLRDTSGNVVLEAMSHGVPVLTLAHQGVDEIVTEETGIKVRPENPEQVVRDLAKALVLLADDFTLRKKLGSAGSARIEEFYLWDRKGQFLKEVYERAGRFDGRANP